MSMAELRRREYFMAGMTPPSEKLNSNSETPGESSTGAPKLTARLEWNTKGANYLVFTCGEQVTKVMISSYEGGQLQALGLEVDTPKEVC